MRLFELRLYLPYLKAYAIPTNYFLLKKNRKNRTIIFFVFAATVQCTLVQYKKIQFIPRRGCFIIKPIR